MKFEIYKETDEYEPMNFLVSWDEESIQPNGTFYACYWLGYGDPVVLLCSKAWIEEQELLSRHEVNNIETTFEGLYEHFWKELQQ